MDTVITSFDALPWEAVRGGIRKKVISMEGATLALHHVEPGHELMPHSHIYEQMVYILQGTCDFHVGDKTYSVKKGGLLYIPPNVKHYIEVTGDETVIDLDVFTPRRDDFAKIKHES